MPIRKTVNTIFFKNSLQCKYFSTRVINTYIQKTWDGEFYDFELEEDIFNDCLHNSSEEIKNIINLLDENGIQYDVAMISDDVAMISDRRIHEISILVLLCLDEQAEILITIGII